jgi:hypothetical protein
MGGTRFLVALLTLASPSLAQDAQYPPLAPPNPRHTTAHHHTHQQPNTAQFGAPPSPQLVTPSQEGSKSLVTAAEAPLHQLNLVGEKIPPVLMTASADPYAYPRPLTCKTLAAAVDELTVALGPDFDVPPPPGKKVYASGGAGLQLANGAAGSVFPYGLGGLVGMVSGASKRDAHILRALNAGGARRAYLKGLGEARRCPAPATPTHQAQSGPPVHDGPHRPDHMTR